MLKAAAAAAAETGRCRIANAAAWTCLSRAARWFGGFAAFMLSK
ncbi:hypothetical protein [Paenibacillus graminis]